MRRSVNPNKDPEKIQEKKEKKAAKQEQSQRWVHVEKMRQQFHAMMIIMDIDPYCISDWMIRAGTSREEQFKQMFFKYGGGFLVLFVAIMCIFSGWTLSKSHIATLALDDTNQLKEVFFGGEPWMVMCSNENMKVAPAFVSAAKKASLTGQLRWGVIDCAGKLPSNKTLFQRFKLPPVNFTNTPTGYLFANSEPPAKIPEKYILDPSKILDWAVKASAPAIKEIAWGKTFARRCLERDACVMFHTKAKYTAPEWVLEIMSQNRGLSFVSINRKLHKTSFDDKVRAPHKPDIPRLAIMKRAKNEKGEFEYSVTTFRGEYEKVAVTNFITDITVKDVKSKDTTLLKGLPWFDQPPKGYREKAGKEASDKNKAWREERKKQQQQGGGGSGGGGGGGQKNSGGEGGGGGGRASDEKEAAMDEETRRLQAARRAEQQLNDDDDVVVSDLDEEDDGFV